LPLLDRIVERLFGAEIERRVQNAVRAVDDQWWQPVAGNAPLSLDLPWAERRQHLEDCLHEWRTNPLAFRITALTTDFVVGSGIRVRAADPAVQSFVDAFWRHPQNRMALRLYKWSDELVRSGELFIALSRNPADGMSYVREIPALLVDDIELDADDMERELRYHQLTDDMAGRWWLSAAHPRAAEVDQVVLHFAVNRPAGAARGLPDLLPILRWLRRYQDWVEDRARLNKYRSAFLWHCQVTNPAPGELERKRAQYAKAPTPGSILVTDQNEQWQAVHAQLDADDAESDGKAIRLMAAAGAGVPLHFLSEGESATRATAAEMGQPTYRHYKHRQSFLGHVLTETLAVALRRGMSLPDALTRDLGLSVEVEDLTREDNQALAASAASIVSALAEMRAHGWIDDYHAASIALRFAGEALPPDEIEKMLELSAKEAVSDQPSAISRAAATLSRWERAG